MYSLCPFLFVAREPGVTLPERPIKRDSGSTLLFSMNQFLSVATQSIFSVLYMASSIIFNHSIYLVCSVHVNETLKYLTQNHHKLMHCSWSGWFQQQHHSFALCQYCHVQRKYNVNLCTYIYICIEFMWYCLQFAEAVYFQFQFQKRND